MWGKEERVRLARSGFVRDTKDMNTVHVATRTRFFIGIPLPAKARAAIARTIPIYKPYIQRQIPPENWHITFAFLGEIEKWEEYLASLTQPMPQLFAPTVSLTHVGQGLRPGRLWAYAAASPSLQSLHKSLSERIAQSGLERPPDSANRPFVPHVQIASLSKTLPRLGLPDNPATATFAIHELTLFASDLAGEFARYTPKATMAVTA